MSGIREEIIDIIDHLPEEQLENVRTVLTGIEQMIAPKREEKRTLTEREKEEGIQNVVSTMKAIHASDEFIISQLIERYKISEEEARYKLETIEAYTI